MIVPSRSRRIPGREHEFLASNTAAPWPPSGSFKTTSPGTRLAVTVHKSAERAAVIRPALLDPFRRRRQACALVGLVGPDKYRRDQARAGQPDQLGYAMDLLP